MCKKLWSQSSKQLQKRCHLNLFTLATWWPCWMSEWDNFENLLSNTYYDTIHQPSSPLVKPFGWNWHRMVFTKCESKCYFRACKEKTNHGPINIYPPDAFGQITIKPFLWSQPRPWPKCICNWARVYVGHLMKRLKQNMTQKEDIIS